MHSPRVPVHRVLAAALLAAALAPAVRADDDFVEEDEPTPSAQGPAQNRVQILGGAGNVRVIVMPGWRLQVGGPGQLQVQDLRVQGNVGVPGEAPHENAPQEPYLGVVLGPVSPAVRAQLDLPEGVGLSIDGVAEGGPAAKAGVRQFDVIHKFNDQVVCSDQQVTTLVKVAGVGTKVPLTLFRGGREQVVEAVIEEHVVPPAGEGLIFAAERAEEFAKVAADLARRDKEIAEELARRAAGGGVVPGLAPGLVPGLLAGNVRAQMRVGGPGGRGMTAVSAARGTVEIRTADGAKTVTVKDPAGKQVHAGPLDTDADLEKVPEEYREWVREIDGGQPAARLVAPEAEEPEKGGAGPADAARAGGPKN